MEPSVYTRIIRGELPCHKVYEDDTTIVILSIYPSVPGHTLVIPKKQIDRIDDMEQDDFIELMKVVKKVMNRMAEVFGRDYRIGVKVAGFDIPHVHVQLMPCKTGADFRKFETKDEPDHAALAAMAEQLAFK